MGVAQCNYQHEGGPVNTIESYYPIFPAYISSSSNQHDCQHQIESLGSQYQKLQPSVIPMTISVAKQFVVAAHLAQCGDVESNPGPKREPKPDKAKIMADKVMCTPILLYFSHFQNLQYLVFVPFGL